jgi:serine/threonine protein kinase
MSRAAISTASSEPLEAGATIAPGYGVIEHLRRGNDLDVYDVWSHERGARCVVKALRSDRDRSRARHSLVREGELLRRLSHPHIVRAYEAIAEPQPMVVMETLTGATLSVLIDEGPDAGTEDCAQLGLQLGSAIRYLHRHGFLHLDLKPSNVIAEAGRAKLIDLSLARPPGDLNPGIGSYHYLSPEQARGGPVTAAADVWGLGAVLFEIATGEAPFDDDPDAWASAPSASGTYTEAQPERYPQLERRARRAEEVAAVDPVLAGAIGACLAPEPDDRPSIGALLAALEPIAGLPATERRWGVR